MAISFNQESVVCPECHYEGRPTVKRSEFGYWAIFIALLVISFFMLFWPLLIASLVVLSWLLIKRSNRVCPRCRFEIPTPRR